MQLGKVGRQICTLPLLPGTQMAEENERHCPSEASLLEEKGQGQKPVSRGSMGQPGEGAFEEALSVTDRRLPFMWDSGKGTRRVVEPAQDTLQRPCNQGARNSGSIFQKQTYFCPFSQQRQMFELALLKIKKHKAVNDRLGGSQGFQQNGTGHWFRLSDNSAQDTCRTEQHGATAAHQSKLQTRWEVKSPQQESPVLPFPSRQGFLPQASRDVLYEGQASPRLQRSWNQRTYEKK